MNDLDIIIKESRDEMEKRGIKIEDWRVDLVVMDLLKDIQAGILKFDKQDLLLSHIQEYLDNRNKVLREKNGAA